MDWDARVKDLHPATDPLAARIPADQHAVFLPDLKALADLLAHFYDQGFPGLELTDARPQDAHVRRRYERQLGVPLADGALEGITQDAVMTIARDHDFEVTTGQLTSSDLYIAEEMFVCGTAAEVSAVNSVDDRSLPCPGPMTQVIAEEYGRAVRGQVDRYKDWVELTR